MPCGLSPLQRSQSIRACREGQPNRLAVERLWWMVSDGGLLPGGEGPEGGNTAHLPRSGHRELCRSTNDLNSCFPGMVVDIPDKQDN